MKAGDQATITKSTFLFKGVFILQSSTVEILSVKNDDVLVLYRDKEGHPHEIPLKIEDLKL